MTATPLVDLVGSATLRGRFGTELDGAASERLGRALGTTARRRGSRGPMLVGRAGAGARDELRDGLVRGLLLCGHDVKDVGATSPDAFTAGLKQVGAAGGVLVQAEAADAALQVVIFFLDKGPVVGTSLHALAGLADQGDFAAGAGTLDVIALPALLAGHAAKSAPPPPKTTAPPPTTTARDGAANSALDEQTIADDDA